MLAKYGWQDESTSKADDSGVVLAEVGVPTTKAVQAPPFDDPTLRMTSQPSLCGWVVHNVDKAATLLLLMRRQLGSQPVVEGMN